MDGHGFRGWGRQGRQALKTAENLQQLSLPPPRCSTADVFWPEEALSQMGKEAGPSIPLWQGSKDHERDGDHSSWRHICTGPNSSVYWTGGPWNWLQAFSPKFYLPSHFLLIHKTHSQIRSNWEHCKGTVLHNDKSLSQFGGQNPSGRSQIKLYPPCIPGVRSRMYKIPNVKIWPLVQQFQQKVETQLLRQMYRSPPFLIHMWLPFPPPYSGSWIIELKTLSNKSSTPGYL